MRRRLLIAALLLSAPALAAEVYRWVDEAGKTHYGDTVPERYKANARPVSGERVTVVPGVSREAVAKEAAKARPAAAPPAPAPAPAVAQAKPPEPSGTPCEQEWRRFSESNECFAPYMLSSGGIRPEAFQKCTEVKAPLCGPPPPKPAPASRHPAN